MMEPSSTISQNGLTNLLMLDLAFPRAEPLKTLDQVRQSCPKSLIVIFSMPDDQAIIETVFEYGVDACFVKSIPASEMLEPLAACRAGEFVIARTKAASEGDLPKRANVMDLTKRQREILGLLRDGQSNKEIGRKLALSPFTVRNHISVLMRLLRVRSRFELAIKATSIVH